MKFRIPQDQFPPYPAVRDGKIIEDESMEETKLEKIQRQLLLDGTDMALVE